jgi:hypothetical protein
VNTPPPKPDPDEFMRQAAERRPSLAAEFIVFLGENRKWWLLPIFAVLLLLAALVVVSGTGAAPFIYTVF